MKYKFVNTFPHDFLSKTESPLISIYQKTSRDRTENKKDALVFKNLIKETEESLLKKYEKRKIEPLIKMLKSIEKDSLFWSNILDGLALFATLDECIIYNLKSSLKTFSVVADSFHIKPLIKYFQKSTNYQILDLSKDSFKILEGNIYDLSLKELDKDIPTTKEEILGTDVDEPFFTATGGTINASTGKGSFHGHGGIKDAVDAEQQKLFRQIDSIVYENISKKSELPLILLTPKTHQSLFINSSKNSYLKDKTINGSFSDLGLKKIKNELKEYVDELYNNELKSHLKQYQNLRNKEQSSDQLIELVKAAIDGRIQILFIEENKIIPGEIDFTHKKIIQKDINDPKYNDILDELVKLTLEKGGKVFILPKEQMPTDSGSAAIYRY